MLILVKLVVDIPLEFDSLLFKADIATPDKAALAYFNFGVVTGVDDVFKELLKTAAAVGPGELERNPLFAKEIVLFLGEPVPPIDMDEFVFVKPGELDALFPFANCAVAAHEPAAGGGGCTDVGVVLELRVLLTNDEPAVVWVGVT